MIVFDPGTVVRTTESFIIDSPGHWRVSNVGDVLLIVAHKIPNESYYVLVPDFGLGSIFAKSPFPLGPHIEKME